MSQEAFEQLRRMVLQDVSLQEQLRATPDLPSFLDLVVRIGEERGCHITTEDIEAAMRASWRVWSQRWI